MIPQIIHYCWFGKNTKGYMARRCISSFNKLCPGAKIIEWNETNCNIDETPYVREAYDKGLYAFVSDYFRLKVLYEYGGVYLDTDVEIRRRFSETFFKADLVLGYMYECTISTAVIMASPKHPYIKGLLDIYVNMVLKTNCPNNAIFNDYTFLNYPGFRLNGKIREFAPSCFIYPRYYFECPTYGIEGGYSIHHFMGSWHNKKGKLMGLVRKSFKWCRFNCRLLDWWYQNYFRNKLLRRSGYYKKYLEDLHKD